MNKNTRTFNSIRNVSSGLFVQIITTLIKFISRTVFIKTLGVEYLGINGLYSNILSILSLAELGFGQAIIYSMYKPIAENNEQKVVALMNFYKKVYDCVAVIVFVGGVLLIPFLDTFINSELEIFEVKIYYVLFLISTVISYLFSYKSAILNADQNQYIQTWHSLLFSIIQFVLQIIILLFTNNYVYYLVVQILISLLNNIIIAVRTNKLYPYLKEKNELPKEEKKNIKSNVASIAMYKISGVILNNTDNILLSMLVSTAYVGYYSNYLLITSVLNTFINIIFCSPMGSIGNFNATSKNDRKYQLFKFMNLLAGYIYGAVSLVLLFVFNDFIELWVGKEFVLNSYIVFIIIVNFYMPGFLTPSWIFRDTTGLFKKTKYLFSVTALINLILSIIFGKKYGMFGILLATAIARILTNFWYEPFVLYKYVFKQKFLTYIKRLSMFMIIYCISYLLTRVIVKNIIQITLGTIIIKAVVSLIITSLLFLIFFHKSDEVKKIYSYIMQLLKKMMIGYKYERYKKYCKKNNQTEYLMFATPIHGNLGDQAIIYSEYIFFEKHKLKFFEIPTYEQQFYFEYIKSKISDDAIICIHGGGFIGSEWLNEIEFVNKTISEFYNHKIVIFPQTIFFKNDEIGIYELEKTKNVFGKAKKMYLFTREKISYEFAKRNYKNVNVYLVPDIVLSLEKFIFEVERTGVLMCMRKDPEKEITVEDERKIETFLMTKNISIKHTDMVVQHYVKTSKREYEIKNKLKEFASSELVITDRLHGMVFAYLTNTPCIVLSNYNHKIKGVYEWIKKNNKNIIYEENINNIENDFKLLKNCKQRNKKAMPLDFSRLSEIILNKRL